MFRVGSSALALAALVWQAGPALAFEAPASALAAQVVAAADHRHRPFAVVDKRAATITVYRGDGSRIATAPVLLGQAPGDHSAPGVGERAQRGPVPPGERTTPAGRYDTEPGRNLSGERIVWIDYDSALAIHRVRGGDSRSDRLARLASARADDKRVSAGCVVVSDEFFDGVIQPLFGQGRGVIYVMPEDAPWQRLWPALSDEARLMARAPG